MGGPINHVGISPSDIKRCRALFDAHTPPLAYSTMCFRWTGTDVDGHWEVFSHSSAEDPVACQCCDTSLWTEGAHE